MSPHFEPAPSARARPQPEPIEPTTVEPTQYEALSRRLTEANCYAQAGAERPAYSPDTLLKNYRALAAQYSEARPCLTPPESEAIQSKFCEAVSDLLVGGSVPPSAKRALKELAEQALQTGTGMHEGGAIAAHSPAGRGLLKLQLAVAATPELQSELLTLVHKWPPAVEKSQLVDPLVARLVGLAIVTDRASEHGEAAVVACLSEAYRRVEALPESGWGFLSRCRNFVFPLDFNVKLQRTMRAQQKIDAAMMVAVAAERVETLQVVDIGAQAQACAERVLRTVPKDAPAYGNLKQLADRAVWKGRNLEFARLPDRIQQALKEGTLTQDETIAGLRTLL